MGLVSSGEDSDEMQLRRLLEIVSKRGLRTLDLNDLDILRRLLEAKAYSDAKAIKSKAKLLKQINSKVYDRHNPRRLF
jgi:hypothetical protein